MKKTLTALLLALLACDPYPRSAYDKAALGPPACTDPPGSVFFAIPPDLCPLFTAMHEDAVEEFGPLVGAWRVMVDDPPEPFDVPGGRVQVWDRTWCASRRLIVAEHPDGWCASAFVHGWAHAVECPRENAGHVGWDEQPTPSQGAGLFIGVQPSIRPSAFSSSTASGSGSIYERIARVQQKCAARATPE
jgi:hypothetical protein